MSSLSDWPIPQMKNRLAYRRYTIFESTCESGSDGQGEREGGERGDRGGFTFVLEKVAHARSSCEDELRHVLDDLGCDESVGVGVLPCQQLAANSGSQCSSGRGHGPLFLGDMVVYHFDRRTLPCREMSRKKDKPACCRGVNVWL